MDDILKMHPAADGATFDESSPCVRAVCERPDHDGPCEGRVMQRDDDDVEPAHHHHHHCTQLRKQNFSVAGDDRTVGDSSAPAAACFGDRPAGHGRIRKEVLFWSNDGPTAHTIRKGACVAAWSFGVPWAVK